MARSWPVAVLAVLVVAFAVGIGSGFAGAAGGVRPVAVDGLAGLLVRPAGAGDLRAEAAGCAALAVAPGGSCAYALRTGFLASRLRLVLTAGGPATATVTQPSPAVTDSKQLAAGATADFVYRQQGSVLAVACPASSAGPCAVSVR
jgi:hypothetical protein